MHYLIRLIVEANTKQDALEEAGTVMDDLIDQHEFDWYHDGEDGSRWPDCWKPVRLSTKKGQAQVADAIKTEYEEFLQAMNIIRLMCKNFPDEKIFNEDFGDAADYRYARYQFSKACGYHANACYMFGDGGSSITNQRELDCYLEEPGKYWVVQVDCHN